jgi:hypothetical protein
LPEEFATLRRLLEARLGKPSKREFVQVLRLLEVFRTKDVSAAVREASARGVLSSMRSGTWCCAASNGARRGWT